MIAPINPRFNTSELSGLPSAVIQSRITDPADVWPGAPPNFGEQIVPHIMTVQSFFRGTSPSYPVSDEALRDSYHNSEAMRTYPGIMLCVEARQRSTALLKWSIQPEDDSSQEQKDLCLALTKIIDRTPRFLEMRRVLQEALWYGRYGIALQYGKAYVNQQMRTIVKRWEPRHGDKLVFRADDMSGKYDPDQIGIRVSGSYAYGVPDSSRHVQPTMHGLVYWFDKWQMKTFICHKHMIEDGPFQDPYGTGRINGVGIRDRIYWAWYQMSECMANMLEYVERSALGVEIWRYQSGNVNSEAATRKAAQERIGGGRSIVLVPVQAGEDADLYGVQHIEPGGSGLSEIRTIIEDTFLKQIKVYILGQTSTTEADGNGGLGGAGFANIHMASYADIIEYDAINLAETLTTQFLRNLQLENFPSTANIWLKFAISTEADDPAGKMKALESAWNMGAELLDDDVRKIIGSATPKDGDKVLRNPSVPQAISGVKNEPPPMAPAIGPDGNPVPPQANPFGPAGDANDNGIPDNQDAKQVARDNKPIKIADKADNF